MRMQMQTQKQTQVRKMHRMRGQTGRERVEREPKRGDAVSSRAFDEHSQDGRELGKLPGSPCEVAPGMVSQRSERHEPELGTVLGTAPRGPCNPVRHWHGRLRCCPPALGGSGTGGSGKEGSECPSPLAEACPAAWLRLRRRAPTGRPRLLSGQPQQGGGSPKRPVPPLTIPSVWWALLAELSAEPT